VAHGPDGYVWAVFTRCNGAEVCRWAGDAAVAALLRRLPLATHPGCTGETATVALPATIVAVAVFVSVAIDDAPGTPLLFLPDDFRRLGIEPRPGERWTLELAIDLDGATIRATRLIGITPP
jgi:hypothetical protein